MRDIVSPGRCSLQIVVIIRDLELLRIGVGVGHIGESASHRNFFRDGFWANEIIVIVQMVRYGA